jgi:CBS domain containing-hemolysin-like protein
MDELPGRVQEMPDSTQAAQPAVLWPVLAGILVVLTNAFFVTVEFAIVTVRRGQMENLADGGNAAARQMLKMLRDPDWAIAGSQLGITLATILLGVVAETPLTHLIAPSIGAALARVPFLAGLATVISTVVVLLGLSFFHMVLGEQTPKTIALRHPVAAALFIARPMAFFARVTTPIVWVVDQSTAFVLRVLGVGGQTGGHGIHTVEELKDVVRESQEEGVLPYSDQAILLRAMEFGSRFVREAMIPRTDIVAVERIALLSDLLQIFKVSRHSRFPVYDGDLDHISGIVAMKEVLSLLADDPDAVNRPIVDLNLIHPALVVPESRHIGDLFNQMRREQKQMAIVIDEYAGTAGLVTAEELAEEVMGRLIDEWVTEEPSVAAVGGGVFEIDAQSRVDEVNEALELDLPASPDYDTVAGFLLFLIRRIPKTGDVIDYEDLRFSILEMTGPKIERVRVERA